MMQHYINIKSEHPSSLLFYRLGDFYELFFTDAITISQVLNLTLTKRGTYEDKPIPMAGIPHHCADQYIARLLKEGFSIAICEQITDAKDGPVERAVTRIVTPGTLSDDSYLDADQASLLGSLFWHETSSKACGAIAIVELSSGRFTVFESDNFDLLIDECDRSGVKELLVHENLSEDKFAKLKSHAWLLQKRPHWEFHKETQRRALLDHFSTHSLEGFGLTDSSDSIVAAGVVLHYLKITQKKALSHIHSLRLENLEHCLLMDSATREHLELTDSQSKDKKHTLLHLFSPSYTPMGLRLISRWMLKPSNVLKHIRQRQNALLALLNSNKSDDLASILSSIGDVERIVSRLAMYTAKPADLLSLAHALSVIPDICSMLPHDDGLLSIIAKQLLLLTEVKEHIQKTLVDPAPSHMRDGGYINIASDTLLQEYWDLKYDSDHLLKTLEEKEREATGLNLSIHSNRVHGLYITISRSLADKVPAHYKRKQTLKNEERFSIPELLELEVKINNAQEAMFDREKILYQDLLRHLQTYLLQLKKNARLLALLDALLTMSKLGSRHGYNLPSFEDNPGIKIEEGKHPILEMHLEHIVPNDITLNPSLRMMVLTGPNMGGKSTFMRQTAVLTLLAYMGSFVPAAKMNIGPIDRIMTRIGAKDEINKGRSTFMMEMIETAYILNHATPTSLVLLDEIGRGTSTRDGLSIAQATLRGLLERNRSMTIFATHYFELTKMTAHEGVFNAHVGVHDDQDTITFLHKILNGSTDQSYGLHVAKLAGVPNVILELANAYALSNQMPDTEKTTVIPQILPQKDRLGEKITTLLHNRNPDEMSPIEAHSLLTKIILLYNEQS